MLLKLFRCLVCSAGLLLVSCWDGDRIFAPPGAIPCDSQSDCPEAHRCERNSAGGNRYCVLHCRTDSDCPATATCLPASGECIGPPGCAPNAPPGCSEEGGAGGDDDEDGGLVR